jgi:hypothetical protein
MELTVEQIQDLVLGTQRELGKLKWTDIATDLQEFIALPQVLQRSKVEFQSGQAIQFNVMTGTTGSAHHTGLFGIDTVNVTDVMQQGSVPWRHWTADYAFDRRELEINDDEYRVFDLIKVRRTGALLDMAKLMEEDLWSKPADSTDTLMPFGVRYWLTGSATAAGGFNGVDPVGFAAGRAGLSSTTFPRWANYTGLYAVISKEDLVRLMRRAARFTNFISPVPQPQYAEANRSNTYGIYTTYAVVGQMEELLEAQNDNLGNDVASRDGFARFRGNPIIWVPYFETNADMLAHNPVVGINWNTLRPVFLKGEYMREDKPAVASKQHTTLEVHIDCSGNNICRDLRRNFWLQTA